MGERHVTEYYCDRPGCGEKFERTIPGHWDTRTITDLDWMTLRNGSGSKNTIENPPKILCPECTAEFLNFWNAKKEDR